MGLPQINQGISLQLELVSSSNSVYTHTKHITALIYCRELDQQTVNNSKMNLCFVFIVKFRFFFWSSGAVCLLNVMTK